MPAIKKKRLYQPKPLIQRDKKKPLPGQLTFYFDAVFYEAYSRLAADGKCDSAGGMEYIRVLGEWKDAGTPKDIESFIVMRANVAPI